MKFSDFTGMEFGIRRQKNEKKRERIVFEKEMKKDLEK
jgi:hypothetical protein